MSNELNQVQITIGMSSVNSGTQKKGGSWFEAMADAWGEALDAQADRIVAKSEEVADGFESPAQITALTTESLRMSFISNSSHTSLTSVGTALETLARKQ